MEIIQTNITFNPSQGGLGMGGKIGRISNGDFSKFAEGGSRAGQNTDPFVNAVEIDWNGAVRYLPL